MPSELGFSLRDRGKPVDRPAIPDSGHRRVIGVEDVEAVGLRHRPVEVRVTEVHLDPGRPVARTPQRRDADGVHRQIDPLIGSQALVPAIVGVSLLEILAHLNEDACVDPRKPPDVVLKLRSLREASVGALVIGRGKGELLEVVDALRPPSSLAGGLDRGQEQRDQDGDDRDHDEQLDQRETRTIRRG